MELNDLIVKRKSIRKYDMAALNISELDDIQKIIEKIKLLIPDKGKIDFRIIGYDEFFKKTQGIFRIKAPHYIILFSDGSEEAYKNIGYAGELIALELTRMDIGTCWLGGAKSGEAVDCGEYAISIAFGKPLEEFRKNEAEAKRKPLNEIAEGFNNEQQELLKYVRLAPSAVNIQPWYFKCEQDKIHVFRTQARDFKNILMKTLLRRMQKIDIGIAISHFSLKEFEYKVFEINEKNMIYEGTLCFKE